MRQLHQRILLAERDRGAGQHQPRRRQTGKLRRNRCHQILINVGGVDRVAARTVESLIIVIGMISVALFVALAFLLGVIDLASRRRARGR